MSASGATGPERERAELRALTSLRGLAALAVVATHFSATAQSLTPDPIPSLVPRGHMAVDFFFVLSGFIMSYTYAASFVSGRPGAYVDFLGRRVARIMPLHMLVIVLVSGAGGASFALTGSNIFFDGGSSLADFLANLLLLAGLGFGTNFNGPSWSISTEMIAYLFFPILVWGVFSRNRFVIATTAGAALSFLILLAARRPSLELSYDGVPDSLVRCLTEFTLGMLAYRAYAGGRFRVLATDGVTLGISVACVISLLLRIDLPAAILFPFLVVGFATNRGYAARVMETRLPYFLGLVSYSIYLIHNPLRPIYRMIAQALLGPVVPRWEAIAFALVGTIGVVPVAWIAYVAIEKPGRSVVRRLFATRGGARYTAAPTSAR
jgi:peptidoglycan/LPS O-acetylase OafA/YrhL